MGNPSKIISRYVEAAAPFKEVNPGASPYYMVDVVEDLLHRANDGIVFLVDPGGNVKKYGEDRFAKDIKIQLESYLAENIGYAREREDYEEAERLQKKVDAFRARAKVSLKAVVSPKSGKAGWRIQLSPPIQQFSRVSSVRLALAPNEHDMLVRIDHGDYHTLPLKGIKPAERPVLDSLVKQGLIRVVRHGHLPPHFVLTNNGIHAIGTFKGIFDHRAAVWISMAKTSVED